jgi:hypothetical protein
LISLIYWLALGVAGLSIGLLLPVTFSLDSQIDASSHLYLGLGIVGLFLLHVYLYMRFIGRKVALLSRSNLHEGGLLQVADMKAEVASHSSNQGYHSAKQYTALYHQYRQRCRERGLLPLPLTAQRIDRTAAAFEWTLLGLYLLFLPDLLLSPAPQSWLGEYIWTAWQELVHYLAFLVMVLWLPAVSFFLLRRLHLSILLREVISALQESDGERGKPGPSGLTCFPRIP